MDVAKKIKDVTGDYIIAWCQEKKDVKRLKEVSKNTRNFIALRTLFLNRYDEFAELRPSSKAKKPLWQRIEEL